MDNNFYASWQPLFKLSTNEKLRVWSIEVIRRKELKGEKYAVKQTYGEYKGKMIEKEYIVFEGKNIGKLNETSIQEQAVAEAYAKFKKKLKEGYVKTQKAARQGSVDKVIKGGVSPMLCKVFELGKTKLTYPLLGQPKLDGTRCTAELKNDEFTLWTRSRKQITSCPHIVEQLNEIYNDIKGRLRKCKKLEINGELYIHGLNDEEKEILSGAIRKKEPSEESLKVNFHIFDCNFDFNSTIKPVFAHRIDFIKTLPTSWYFNIHIVETFSIHCEEDVEPLHDDLVEEGYEGLILRNPYSFYQYGKKTNDCMKYKKFKDSEFKIVDVTPGEDKTVVFNCINKDGVLFDATKSGDKKKNQKYLKNKKKYIGQMVTVKYQRLTGKNKVPLFPVALRIRNEL